jgi:hypothetical protein
MKVGDRCKDKVLATHHVTTQNSVIFPTINNDPLKEHVIAKYFNLPPPPPNCVIPDTALYWTQKSHKCNHRLASSGAAFTYVRIQLHVPILLVRFCKLCYVLPCG